MELDTYRPAVLTAQLKDARGKLVPGKTARLIVLFEGREPDFALASAEAATPTSVETYGAKIWRLVTTNPVIGASAVFLGALLVQLLIVGVGRMIKRRERDSKNLEDATGIGILIPPDPIPPPTKVVVQTTSAPPPAAPVAPKATAPPRLAPPATTTTLPPPPSQAEKPWVSVTKAYAGGTTIHVFFEGTAAYYLSVVLRDVDSGRPVDSKRVTLLGDGKYSMPFLNCQEATYVVEVELYHFDDDKLDDRLAIATSKQVTVGSPPKSQGEGDRYQVPAFLRNHRQDPAPPTPPPSPMKMMDGKPTVILPPAVQQAADNAGLTAELPPRFPGPPPPAMGISGFQLRSPEATTPPPIAAAPPSEEVVAEVIPVPPTAPDDNKTKPDAEASADNYQRTSPAKQIAQLGTAWLDKGEQDFGALLGNAVLGCKAFELDDAFRRGIGPDPQWVAVVATIETHGNVVVLMRKRDVAVVVDVSVGGNGRVPSLDFSDLHLRELEEFCMNSVLWPLVGPALELMPTPTPPLRVIDSREFDVHRVIPEDGVVLEVGVISELVQGSTFYVVFSTEACNALLGENKSIGTEPTPAASEEGEKKKKDTLFDFL